MTYSVRFDTDGYHVNAEHVGYRVTHVAQWLKINAPDVKGVVKGACALARMPDVATAVIQRTTSRGWHTIAMMRDGTIWKEG